MESNQLISIGLPISLVIIMAGIGMTLTINDFRRIAHNPKGLILGSVAQIVGMPALALIIALGFNLPAEIAVGLVIVAACPGGTSSNLFVLLSRGNVALSIMLTVISSLVTIITLPIAASYALTLFGASSVNITLPVEKMITMMVAVVLIPVIVGMLVRNFWPSWSMKSEAWINKLGGITLLLLVLSICYDVGSNLFNLLAQAGAATLTLNIGGILAGLAIAKVSRLPNQDGLAIGIELGVKNSTLALLVSVTLIGSNTMSIPIIVYSVSMFLCAAVLTVYGRRLSPGKPVAAKVA